MGIKDLLPIIRSKCKDCIHNRDISYLYNKKVVIDILIYLYTFLRISEEWKHMIYNFLSTLKSHNVIAIFVFDGIQSTVDKLKTRLKRAELYKTQLKRISMLEELIDILENVNIVPIYLQNYCMNHLTGKKYKMIDLDKSNPTNVIIEIRDEIRHLNLISKRISTEDIKFTIDLINIFGFYSIECIGEAESICSFMVNNGYADFVLTEDSDILTYNTKHILYKYNIYNKTFLEIDMKNILSTLNFSIEQFVDMCILLGCDYNSRMKGYGPVKCFDLISRYKNIESIIIENKLSDEYISSINYKRCREIFLSNITDESIIEGIKKSNYINRSYDIEEVYKFMNIY